MGKLECFLKDSTDFEKPVKKKFMNIHNASMDRMSNFYTVEFVLCLNVPR